MKRYIRLLSLALACLLLLSSCGGSGGTTSLGGVENRLTLSEYKIADFSLGAVDGFWARNDRGNGPPFNCAFRSSNALINNGKLTLVLSKSEGGYVGAEYGDTADSAYVAVALRRRHNRAVAQFNHLLRGVGTPRCEVLDAHLP